jgi:hypothetical protein
MMLTWSFWRRAKTPAWCPLWILKNRKTCLDLRESLGKGKKTKAVKVEALKKLAKVVKKLKRKILI